MRDICDSGGEDQYREREHRCSSSNSGKKRRSKMDLQEGSGAGIARACTECGKKFWSWKALFGHMRCHPERQWRGINPPPNFRRQQQHTIMTQEDHEVAACLLLLANANANSNSNANANAKANSKAAAAKLKAVAVVEDCSVESPPSSHTHTHFECSSCNKVFGSHQALGGHRASHKNVKGCFANTAITTSTARMMTWTAGGQQQPPPQGGGGGGDTTFSALAADHHHHHQDHHPHPLNIMMPRNSNGNGDGDGGYGEGEAVTVAAADHDGGGGHKCSICLRVFTTGQALGGHKRCHWERGDNVVVVDSSSSTPKSLVDLNLPLPLDDVDRHCSTSSSSPLTLDLRLGL